MQNILEFTQPLTSSCILNKNQPYEKYNLHMPVYLINYFH